MLTRTLSWIARKHGRNGYLWKNPLRQKRFESSPSYRRKYCRAMNIEINVANRPTKIAKLTCNKEMGRQWDWKVAFASHSCHQTNAYLRDLEARRPCSNQNDEAEESFYCPHNSPCKTRGCGHDPCHFVRLCISRRGQ